jgi:rhomboid protease GluP
MAFGFSPKYQVEVSLNDLTKEQFLLLGVESAKKLEWNIGTVTPEGFFAYTQFSMSSWSEVVSVKIMEERVLVRSECSGSQLLDWGKNKNNVKHFLWELKQLKEQTSAAEIAQRYEELIFMIKNKENDHVYETLPN